MSVCWSVCLFVPPSVSLSLTKLWQINFYSRSSCLGTAETTRQMRERERWHALADPADDTLWQTRQLKCFSRFGKTGSRSYSYITTLHDSGLWFFKGSMYLSKISSVCMFICLSVILVHSCSRNYTAKSTRKWSSRQTRQMKQSARSGKTDCLGM